MSRATVGEPRQADLASIIGQEGMEALRRLTLETDENAPGWVYFIGNDERVKIGYSNNPRRRLKALRREHGKDLTLLACERGTFTREATYHMLYRSCWISGEWFSRTPEIEAEIARLQEVAA